jgi:hypothetical protein
LKALIVQDNKIVFNDQKNALEFAQSYLKRQMAHWGGFEAVFRYAILAKALKRALENNIISMNDFLKDDAYIIDKLKKSKDKDIEKILKILRHKSLTKLAKSKTIVHKKFRYVDPLFLKNGVLVRLSKVDKKFKTELKVAQKENSKGIILPLLAA